MDLKAHIRGIPDFPRSGILFYDISTLIAHPKAWKNTVDQMVSLISQYQPDVIAGIEARGFLIASPLALKMGCGVVMVRKPDKLPGKTISQAYELEYGTDSLEIQSDSVKKSARVVIVDDLLATGGTMKAASQLFKKIGADVVGTACIIELTFLNGRHNLSSPFSSLLHYED